MRLLATRISIALFALFVFAGGRVEASGGTDLPAPSQPRSPREEAIDHYNRGLGLRDKAWRLEEEAARADSDGERAKKLDKAREQFGKAAAEFRLATEKNPQLHQAWSSLGYALRKTGHYDDSLAAYDEALALAPDYTEAIEYRGEAYLRLGRLDEAKQAYLSLFTADRPKADQLLAAMRGWIGEQRSGQPTLTEAQLGEFEAWVGEREELARQSAALYGGEAAHPW